jgi:peptidoglycan hydrolase-like protein with peptidoglycan-binding domain
VEKGATKVTFTVTYPEKGRGAWPAAGTGGTLSADGKAYGRYYRKQYSKKGYNNPVKTPGRVAYNAVLNETEVSINDYAVYKAIQSIQRWVGAPTTGLFDAATKDAVIDWQTEKGLTADGIFGPATSRALVEPVILSQATLLDKDHPILGKVAVGFVSWESGWDFGAVGGLTPEDLGLFQINGPAHPSMSVDQRLSILPSVQYGLNLIRSNLAEFEYDLDAGIAAYNLGKQGARDWIAAGRPDVWERVGKSTDVRRYIDAIKKGAGL